MIYRIRSMKENCPGIYNKCTVQVRYTYGVRVTYRNDLFQQLSRVSKSLSPYLYSILVRQSVSQSVTVKHMWVFLIYRYDHSVVIYTVLSVQEMMPKNSMRGPFVLLRYRLYRR